MALWVCGLALIKQGRLDAGRRQIEAAVVHDPASSLVRAYLGQAYVTERRDEPAGKQFAIAKELDPSDPTPWFYNAIRLQLANQPVAALRDVDKSIESQRGPCAIPLAAAAATGPGRPRGCHGQDL